MATKMIMTAPSFRDRIAAGPAMLAASKAPNSQPDPMIEPTPVKRRPSLPISHFNPLSWTNVTLVGGVDDSAFSEGTVTS